MDWLNSNWVWIALVVGFLALHLFGHGHRGHRYADHGRRRNVGDDDRQRPSSQTPDHTHASSAAEASSTPNEGSGESKRPAHRHRGC